MLLIFEKDFGGAFKHASADNMDTDAIKLGRATRVVQKHIFDQKHDLNDLSYDLSFLSYDLDKIDK